jgi:hypothetical protein
MFQMSSILTSSKKHTTLISLTPDMADEPSPKKPATLISVTPDKADDPSDSKANEQNTFVISGSLQPSLDQKIDYVISMHRVSKEVTLRVTDSDKRGKSSVNETILGKKHIKAITGMSTILEG